MNAPEGSVMCPICGERADLTAHGVWCPGCLFEATHDEWDRLTTDQARQGVTS